MGVPTHYGHILDAIESQHSEASNKNTSNPFKRFRLLISGSAALPAPFFRRAEAQFGQRLLERYGMSEFGMGLSNPLKGSRKISSVGQPFTHCETALLTEQDSENPLLP